MRVAWSLAKIAQTNNQQLRALRAYTILTESGRGGVGMTRKELQQIYHDLGISRSTMYRDLRALEQPFGSDGNTTLLTYGEPNSTILLPRSVYRIIEDLEIVNLGFITVPETTLQTFQQFKDVTYASVAYGCNRDENGGTTISRASITKLTGLSESGQRSRERRLGVVVQPNVAEVVRAQETNHEAITAEYLLIQYGPRQRPENSPDAVQMRNTFQPKGPGITQLADHYIVRGTPARHQLQLQPEYGEWSLRQTLNFLPSPELLADMLAQKIDVDVWSGSFVHPLTGERWGRYMRFLHIANYTPEEMTKGLDNASQSRATAWIDY